jgi:hypothetical protein
MAPALGVTALQPLVGRLGVDGIYFLTAALAALMALAMVAWRSPPRPTVRGEEA